MLKRLRSVAFGFLLAVSLGATAFIGGGVPVHNHSSNAQGGTDLPTIVPIGTVLDYAGTSLPTGFALADGSTKSRATCATLFTALGTTWGAGDGTTTFNLPNFARRVTVGSGGTGTATLANSVGSLGGEETHLLLATESGLVNHGHTASGSWAYNVGTATTGGAFNSGSPGNGSFNNAAFADASMVVSVSVNGSGSANASVAHNNIQPSAVVQKIIKTGC